MELLSHLALGFEVALSLQNLTYCFLGVLLGTLIGVLPGLGPTATIAMLLPITFTLPPTASLIMLAGIYYGSAYGGSTTAILVNLPGEASSVVTAIDGYQMARQGRAGPALAIAAIGSFFAGTVATFVIAAFAIPLTKVALSFGPAEYFSLIVLGMIAAVALAHGSVLKALAMVAMGVAVGLVGTDVYTGVARYTFGFPALLDGVELVAIAMGLFGLSEVIRNLEQEDSEEGVAPTKVGSLMPTREDLRAAVGPILRGTALGSFLGILPGSGSILSSFTSYTLEKKLSKTPERFGKGAIEGVAGPESANNASAQTSFIPMLTLGIPTTGVMSLMIGAMMIQGISPGPSVAVKRPDLFWGVIVSMWIGNLMLVILNLPLVGMWAKLLTVPYRVLFPTILAFCIVGSYTINNSSFDLYVVAVFSLFGYLLIKLGCEPAPFLLGFILGPMLEEHLQRAMMLSDGDPMTFITNPISGVLLGITVVILAALALPSIVRRRAQVFVEEE